MFVEILLRYFDMFFFMKYTLEKIRELIMQIHTLRPAYLTSSTTSWQWLPLMLMELTVILAQRHRYKTQNSMWRAYVYILENLHKHWLLSFFCKNENYPASYAFHIWSTSVACPVSIHSMACLKPWRHYARVMFQR